MAELEGVGLWLGVPESEPVAEGEAPGDRVALGLRDWLLLELGVPGGVLLPVPLAVAL